MWIAGVNFFNSAVDADPRHFGRHGWAQSDPRWRALMADGKEMFAELRKLDPTRVYYSHAGLRYGRCLHGELLPGPDAAPGARGLAERVGGKRRDADYDDRVRHPHGLHVPARARWLCQQHHQRAPVDGIRRHLLWHGRLCHGGAKVPAVSSRASSAAECYTSRSENQSGSIMPIMHKIQHLFRARHLAKLADRGSAGRPAHLVAWMQDALKEVNGPTLAWIAGRPEAYTAKDHHFSSGQKIQKQIVLINDTRQPQDFTASLDRHGRREGSGQGRTARHPGGFGDPQSYRSRSLRPPGKPAARPTARSRSPRPSARPRTRTPLRSGSLARTRRARARSLRLIRNGLTSKMLANLGYTTRAWNGAAAPLVVIGRNALKNDPRWLPSWSPMCGPEAGL